MINLLQARELVHHLEMENQAEANKLLASIFLESNRPLFSEIGKLTRDLHTSIIDFQVNPTIAKLTSNEIPYAMERLNYVLDKTESSVNRTMDAIEVISPVSENLQTTLSTLHLRLNQLVSGEIEMNTFKVLYYQIENLVNQINADGNTLNQQLKEILMAQDFQDLIGQVIGQVIVLLRDIEAQLVQVLVSFDATNHDAAPLVESSIKPEGPVVTKKQQNDKQVMGTQDDVDDLLSSLGF